MFLGFPCCEEKLFFKKNLVFVEEVKTELYEDSESKRMFLTLLNRKLSIIQVF